MGGGQKGGESDAMFTTDNWHFPPPLLLSLPWCVRKPIRTESDRGKERNPCGWLGGTQKVGGWIGRGG